MGPDDDNDAGRAAAPGVDGARPAETPARPRRGKRGLAFTIALLALVGTRLPLVIEAGVLELHAPFDLPAGHFLYHGGEPHEHWLVDSLQKWDSYWFLHIVREGYQFYGPVEQISNVEAGQPETNVTPFPLYPLLMRAAGAVVGDPSVGGLLVSQVALLLALMALFSLAALDRGRAYGELAVWLFACVPWAYAFSAIYSESVFFACTVGSVLALRRDRYLTAGLLGMLAALTRLPGVLVFVPLLIEHAERYGWWPFRGSGATSRRGGAWRVALLLLVPAGTALYFGYLWWLTGEPTAYFIAQQGWHKELVPIWHHPVAWLTADELGAEQVLDIVVFVAVAATLVAGWRRIRWSYFVYAVIGTAMLMSSSYLLGLPRYAAGLFPLYLIWADLGMRWPALGRGLLIAFAMLAPLVFWVWTRWYYAF